MKLNTIKDLRGYETARIAEETAYSYLDFGRITGISEEDLASYLIYLFTETTTFLDDIELCEEEYDSIKDEVKTLINEYSMEDSLTLWEPKPSALYNFN